MFNRCFVKKLLSVFFLLVVALIPNVFAQKNEQPLLKDVNAVQLQSIIKSYEGKKAVLVNFWATWCIPCVEEFPEIMKIQNKYPEQLQVIFVSWDFPEKRESVISFLKKHQVTWTTYLSTDRSASFIRSFSDEWSGAVPFTKIINKQGTVVASWENKADITTFNKNVKRAIK